MKPTKRVEPNFVEKKEFGQQLPTEVAGYQISNIVRERTDGKSAHHKIVVTYHQTSDPCVTSEPEKLGFKDVLKSLIPSTSVDDKVQYVFDNLKTYEPYLGTRVLIKRVLDIADTYKQGIGERFDI